MEQILLMILTRIEKYREGGGRGQNGKGGGAKWREVRRDIYYIIFTIGTSKQ